MTSRAESSRAAIFVASSMAVMKQISLVTLNLISRLREPIGHGHILPFLRRRCRLHCKPLIWSTREHRMRGSTRCSQLEVLPEMNDQLQHLVTERAISRHSFVTGVV